MKFFFDLDKKKKWTARERLLKRDTPHFLLEIIRKYFRLEVEGLENIPKKGAALIVPNHSGFTALDAIMIGNEIYRERKTIVRILAHPLWFLGPHIRILAKSMGMVEANKKVGENLLKKKKKVIIFPEGEKGNFKPSSLRYKLQEFRRGFIRMAMATQSPIIPTVVIGAEETNINLSQVRGIEKLRGFIIPVPLNMLPLPAKWKIVFLKALDMTKYTAEDASNKVLVHKLSKQVKNSIQKQIDKEIKNRKWVYFPKGSARSKTKDEAIKEQTKLIKKKIIARKRRSRKSFKLKKSSIKRKKKS